MTAIDGASPRSPLVDPVSHDLRTQCELELIGVALQLEPAWRRLLCTQRTQPIALGSGTAAVSGLGGDAFVG